MRHMTRERYLSDAELGRFMAAVRSRRHPNQPRDHALFAILANTGIRPEEARALRRCDVRVSGRSPRLVLHRRKRPHGPDPINVLPVHPEVAAVVSRWMQTMGDTNPDAKLFAFTKRQSRRLFHYYARLAGIDSSRRLYSLRHAVGMRLWRHTRDVRLIQGIMGHVRLKASAMYMHIGQDVLRTAYNAIDAVAAQ